MKYKDYSGSVEYSDEDGVFFGRIIGINDRITFDGDNVKSLRIYSASHGKTLNSTVEEAIRSYIV